MVPPPHFASCEEVLPYLTRNLHLLTMTEINNACAWGLDPGFVQHSIIVDFMRSLRPISNEQLPTEQECHICFRPFITHACSGIPAVRLRCGHIVGTNCLYEWLQSRDCCPHCHIKTFFRPAHWPQQHLLSPRQTQVLRGLLESGRKFLAEIRSSSGSGSGLGSLRVEGFEAFRNWAWADSGVSNGNLVARIHARAHISRWQAYNSDSGSPST